jgi:hypothetical protein
VSALDVTAPIARRHECLDYYEVGDPVGAHALALADELQAEIEACKCPRCGGWQEHAPVCPVGQVLAAVGFQPAEVRL